MNRVKELLAVVLGGRLVIEGKGGGRTFAKVPLWLAVAAALCSPQLAVVTAVLVVAFGMNARIEKA